MSDTEDFAAMFEASLKARRVERGQTIEGTIVAIGPEVAFVDVGGKGEATIDVSELKDEDGDIEVAVGDRIQAVVVSTAGGLTLSRKLARGAATARQLEDAFHSGLPVEGRVEKEVKGGYEVRIAGQRAFCPFSQIDTARGTDPATHVGKVYTFIITEYRGERQEPRRLAAHSAGRSRPRDRRGSQEVDRRRRSDDRTRGVRARVRRVRRPRWRRAGVAACVRNGMVPHLGPVASPQAGGGDHRQGPAGRRCEREDFTWTETAHGGSVVDSSDHVRGRPGVHGPRDACHRLRRLR